MPNLKDYSEEDQARFKDLAQAVLESLRNIDRLEFKKRGFRLLPPATKANIIYLVMSANREKKPKQSDVDFIAQEITKFIGNERREEERRVELPVDVERRKRKIA